MNHTARLSRRTVKQVGAVSPQARVNLQLQLAYMQCQRHGHLPGVPKTVGAYRREIAVCRRCFRVVGQDGSDVVKLGEQEAGDEQE